MQALTEKLQLFAEMAESVTGLEDAASRSRLLLRGDFSDLQQGEILLKGAITEGRTKLHYDMCICFSFTGEGTVGLSDIYTQITPTQQFLSDK